MHAFLFFIIIIYVYLYFLSFTFLANAGMSAVTPNRVATGGGANVVLTVNKPANWVNVTCDFNGIKVVPSNVVFTPYSLAVCFSLKMILFLFTKR